MSYGEQHATTGCGPPPLAADGVSARPYHWPSGIDSATDARAFIACAHGLPGAASQRRLGCTRQQGTITAGAPLAPRPRATAGLIQQAPPLTAALGVRSAPAACAAVLRLRDEANELRRRVLAMGAELQASLARLQQIDSSPLRRAA